MRAGVCQTRVEFTARRLVFYIGRTASAYMMISMRCCTHLCSDVRKQGEEFHFLHRGTWNCEAREDGDTSFYRMFQRLPPEMKLHVLSFCQFHVLAHEALWLRDEDPGFLPHLLATNPHFTSRCSEQCPRSPAYTIATGQVRVNVAFIEDDVVEHVMSKQNHELSELTIEECEELSELFGKTNRYVSPYYRRCEHHDTGKPSDVTPHSPEELWKRLARTRGVEVHEEALPILRHIRISQRSETFPEEILPYDAVLPPTNVYPLHKSDIVLEPGTYHFEYLDHALENIVAACDGRSNHFLLDPSDESHKSVSQRTQRLVCMALVFRRVLHPRDEVGDTYSTVKQFQGAEDTYQRYRASNTSYAKRMLLTFSRADEARQPEWEWSAVEKDEGAKDSSMPGDTGTNTNPFTTKLREQRINGYEPHLVFQHVLSRPFYERVCRFSSIAGNRTCFYVEFKPLVQLFNIEQSRSGLRINFFVDVNDMTKLDIGSYVSGIKDLVYKSGRSFYGFRAPPSLSSLDLRFDDRHFIEEIFELFFPKRRLSSPSLVGGPLLCGQSSSDD